MQGPWLHVALAYIIIYPPHHHDAKPENEYDTWLIIHLCTPYIYVGSTYVMEYGGIDDFDRILIRSIMYIWMWSTPIWTLGADYISHFFLLFYMSARFIPDVRRLDYNQNRFFCLFCTRALISSLLHPCLLWYLLHLGILHKIIRSILIG